MNPQRRRFGVWAAALLLLAGPAAAIDLMEDVDYRVIPQQPLADPVHDVVGVPLSQAHQRLEPGQHLALVRRHHRLDQALAVAQVHPSRDASPPRTLPVGLASSSAMLRRYASSWPFR